MAEELNVGVFSDYFVAVHGHSPFLWQRRLLEQVVTEGWPEVITAPTGAGKTAVLDVAVFHLAMEARAGAERRAPLRIVFAVNRRVIVDQAEERARRIARRLRDRDQPILRTVCDALSALSSDSALHVEALRGGLPREDDWARTPAQPTILSTTIDQLGSRLLFRGYGVSTGMAPVHAGLLGEDALLLLDEAHLAAPFEETLQGVRRWRAERGEGGAAVSRPWAFVTLTATPRKHEKHEKVFALNNAERSEGRIADRLAAEKRATLVEVKADAGSADHARALAEAARDLAKGAGRTDPVVAVIVNRVRIARAVHALLSQDATTDQADKGNRQAEPEPATPDNPANTRAILLTGRVRPAERDRLVTEYENWLNAGAQRPQRSGPLFVIATQCIEAGADFDLDVMVSQIASLDALRQRFGRLDRLGSKSPTAAVIIAAKDEIAKKADDAIYGDRARLTWEWLGGHKAEVDFGPAAMDARVGADPDGAAACQSAPGRAPLLRMADADFLSMTNPKPHPDPCLPLFLHGEPETGLEVGIVWRADLPEWPDSKATDSTMDETVQATSAILAAVPPRPGEVLRVPIWEARRWLGRERHERRPADDSGDVPSSSWTADEDDSKNHRFALRWRGPVRDGARGSDDEERGTRCIRAADLRPGDLLVVPSDFGGCDPFGWAPESEAPAPDIADLAAEPYLARHAAIRLHPKLRNAATAGADWKAILEIVSDTNRSAAKRLIARLLEPDVELSGPLRKRFDRFAKAERLRLSWPYDEDSRETSPGVVIIAPKGLPDAPDDTASADAVTDGDDAGSFRTEPQMLGTHQRAVGDTARSFALACGLPERTVATLALAGLWHDAGKADPRFQRYLRGFGETSAGLLAKSGRASSPAADRAARLAADLPSPWRHEVVSVLLAVERLKAMPREDIDADLLLWLIGTHHGQGRPFFHHADSWEGSARDIEGEPVPTEPGPHRLDFDWRGLDWAGLFACLKARYGVWGLAHLEAVLRLADHRASEAAERGDAPAEAAE